MTRVTVSARRDLKKPFLSPNNWGRHGFLAFVILLAAGVALAVPLIYLVETRW